MSWLGSKPLPLTAVRQPSEPRRGVRLMSGLAACACRPIACALEAYTPIALGVNPMTSRAHSSDSLDKRASRTLDGGMLVSPTFPTFSDQQGARDDGLWLREQGEHTTAACSRRCNARLASPSPPQPEAT